LIPYSTQHITLLDRIRVFRALGKPYLTQGPAVEDFERAVSSYVGAEHAVAVNSATSALHIACLALGLGPGDIMWTTPISFVASANCGRYCGAEVDFVDIDPGTFNMSPQELRIKLESASKRGTLPKVLVVVHLAGEPAEMAEIAAEAKEYGVKIIEDASHALGSSYLGEKVGSGTYSDITVFSFHAVKNMTTGEGGMAVTQSGELANSMRLLRSHGITRESSEFLTEITDRSPWHYEQQAIGFNFRLTDFQSVLGKSQLKRLENENKYRSAIYSEYRKLLGGNPSIQFQRLESSSTSAFHLAVIRVPTEKRVALANALSEAGYGSNLHYSPIHLQPYYQNRSRHHLPNAEAYGKSAISLPCQSGLNLRRLREISRMILSELN
jgi:UDP-4-amino-4,6-dideoxy-N-acetyl-beta-L-altrosamine transaminase